MDKVSKTKKEFRLKQWSRIIKSCQVSGMTAAAWCEKNNINVKSYYYWLKKIRAQAWESYALVHSQSNQQIFPVALKQTSQNASITIHFSSISIDIHEGAARDTIETVLSALKSIC